MAGVRESGFGAPMKTQITQEGKTEHTTASIPRVTCKMSTYVGINREQEQPSTTQPRNDE
jgi:hypothetical protein